MFVHGNLAYARDCRTVAGFTANASATCSWVAALIRISDTAANRRAAPSPRWETRLTDAGLAGLLAERKGPKRKSKLTGDAVAAIRRLREDGWAYRAIAAATRVSDGSVCAALTDTDTEEPGAPQQVVMLTCRQNRRWRSNAGLRSR